MSPLSLTVSHQTHLKIYFEEVFRKQRLALRSENTLRLYGITIGNFGRFLVRPPLLSDLNDESVTALMTWLLDKGNAPRTANKHRDQLLAVWRFACRKGHLTIWPDVEPAPELTRVPTAWTTEQLGSLFGAIRAINTEPHFIACIEDIPACDWWLSFVGTLYFTGIRVGAALELLVTDFDPKTGRLLVRAETQKNRSDQIFLLPQDLVDAISKTLRDRPKRRKLFPWPKNRTYLWAQFSKILTRAGLPTTYRDKFHKLRRTCATFAELYAGPGSATRYLGHTNPEVTARYIDASLLPENNVAEQIPNPFRALEIPEFVPRDLPEVEPQSQCIEALFAQWVTSGCRYYVSAVRKFINDKRISKIEEITTDTIRGYSADLILRGMVPQTADNYRKAIAHFVWFLRVKHNAPISPDVVAELQRVMVTRRGSPRGRRPGKGGAA